MRGVMLNSAADVKQVLTIAISITTKCGYLSVPYLILVSTYYCSLNLNYGRNFPLLNISGFHFRKRKPLFSLRLSMRFLSTDLWLYKHRMLQDIIDILLKIIFSFPSRNSSLCILSYFNMCRSP